MIWRCVHCRSPLRQEGPALCCTSCGKQYPVIAGIPILVSEPAAYLRSELASLRRAYDDAKQRRDGIVKLAHDAGLSNIALERHQDVIKSEIARAKKFLALLEPAVPALAALAGNAQQTGDTLGVKRSGWAFDTLFPYLLRDWTYSSEFAAANSVIGAVLKEIFPAPSGKSIAFAGCGAAGLLGEISPHFAHVLGYDLALPMLAAARHLLDGETLDFALPRSTNTLEHVSLKRRNLRETAPRVELVAMDAYETACVDGAIDCVITSFLIDLTPDPRILADEIHRILSGDGIWINYGPSGTRDALWRFDQTEGASFFESAGFSIVRSEAHRATYLDLSQNDPSSSFQNHMCYLTAGRKRARGEGKPRVAMPDPAALARIVPQHFPGASLVQQHDLGIERARTILLRHERLHGRVENLEIGSDTARIIALVDGKRTVGEIASLLKQRNPAQSSDQIIRAFIRYFDQGVLSWRDPDK